MTVVCIACRGEGVIERTATPTEVDAGCELGVAYDECEECKGRGVVFDVDKRVEEVETLLGVADFGLPEGHHAYIDKTPLLAEVDYEHQARQGQGPPA